MNREFIIQELKPSTYCNEENRLTLLLKENEIHLIIMDVGLPWINGFELAQMIKDHNDLKRIPLVFLSAQADPEDIEKARSVDADDYIKKPFDIDKIKKAVSTLLKINHGS